MSNKQTEVFTGRLNLNLEDFYPDDMPKEWYFDYYSSYKKALALPLDTNEDLVDILSDIQKEFCLVLDVTNIANNEIISLLNIIDKSKNNFILFSKKYNLGLINIVKNYNFCLQLDNKININTTSKYYFFNDKHLFFNTTLVLYTNTLGDENDIRLFVERIINIKEKIALIQVNADSDTIDKTRVICELFGI